MAVAAPSGAQQRRDLRVDRRRRRIADAALHLFATRGYNVTSVDEISAAIAVAVGQQGTATQEIAQNVQQAAARTGEVSQNISGVTAGIAATGTAAEEVLGSAIELSKQSQRLRDEVDRFLAQIRAA